MLRIHTLRVAILVAFLSGSGSMVFATRVTFFEAPSANGSDPFSPENVNAYNAWRLAIGEIPDFGEDWDGNNWLGNPWQHGQVFDVQNVPTAIFVDGVSFANVGADSNRRAQAHTNPGTPLALRESPSSTEVTHRLAWMGDVSGISTIFFPNPVDYLGFFTFDTDNPVTYRLLYSDGFIESIPGKKTGNNNQNLYRFVGFVNDHPTERITQFEIVAPAASRYGIDELQWGRRETAPEPGTLIWIVAAALGLLHSRSRRRSASP